MSGVFSSVRKNTNKRRLRYVGLGLAAASVMAAQPILVSAHQNPSGCNGNRLNTSIVKDHTEVYQGQTLTYTVTVSNLDFGSDIACDITNATVKLRLPAADGTPTGTEVTLAGGVNYPAGTPITVVGSAQYVVNVNPGVTDIVTQVSADGTLHDAPVDHSALIVKTIGTSIVAAPTTPPSSGGGGGSTPSASSQASSLPKLPNTGLARKL